jgi:hypothetical protein
MYSSTGGFPSAKREHDRTKKPKTRCTLFGMNRFHFIFCESPITTEEMHGLDYARLQSATIQINNILPLRNATQRITSPLATTTIPLQLL